jgi:hypothetical protein
VIMTTALGRNEPSSFPLSAFSGTQNSRHRWIGAARR